MHRTVLFCGVVLLAGCSNKQAASDLQPTAPLSKPSTIVAQAGPKILYGLSKQDRARISVYEYAARTGCDASLAESQLLLLGGKRKRGEEPLTWESIWDHLDSSNASTVKQFSAIVASLRDYPDLVSALKQHRDIVNECNRAKIEEIAVGSISAKVYQVTHSAQLNAAVAKINTELDLLPVAPESQSFIP